MNEEKNINYLETLIDGFIDQPKFGSMSPAEKQEFKAALVQNYNDRITSLIILNMPREKSTEFTEIAESGNPEATQDFIMKNIPNFEQLVQNESTAFLQALIATDTIPDILNGAPSASPMDQTETQTNEPGPIAYTPPAQQ